MPHPEMPSVPDVSPAAERARLLGLSDPSPSGAMLPRLMIVPTLVLVALGAGLTLVAGPLFDVSDQAARDLLQRTPYLEAVFPREAP